MDDKMGKSPASQFYWGDWINDVELQSACSASRGIWINALARMWFSKTKGELTAIPEKLAQILNCSKEEFDIFLSEAETLHFCYMSRNGNATVTLRNRRMYKEEKVRQATRSRVATYREKQGCNTKGNIKVMPPSSSSSSSSKNIYSKVAKKIINYLNKIGGRKFSHSEGNLKHIRARLKEKHTEEDCKKVIDVKWADPEFDKKYFRPATLFNSEKFEGYLNERPRKRWDEG